ncbi:hypothetical protein BDF20DRAFT_523198 [Mycotypha africana]|uniref:uncharacterized protein n=1 Tax=Mycotypha africana TaxID=64632 RepID=UPI0022FFF3D0|nr:uncharacterized protein BDF20DRAFT_523198 [Mycotypha africana]KAI8979651.1 hypothetical protein BDF20DRAFT_523198 [Mycotypha africana]
MSHIQTEVFAHPMSSNSYSYLITEEDDVVLEELTSSLLTTSTINEWLQKSPRAKATLVLQPSSSTQTSNSVQEEDFYTIQVPVYALRRRNAIVADLPDAPLYHHQHYYTTAIMN